MSERSLAGRVVLVSGGAVGIGRAVILACAEAGARVGIHYNRSNHEAMETLALVRKTGSEGLLLRADLTEEQQAIGIVETLLAHWGRLDGLVNNAGGLVERSRIEDCSSDLWRRSFAVNVDSAFYLSKAAIPALRAGGQGAIVNNLSLSVQTGGAGGAGAYAAAKGALQVLTRTLARELAPTVRVNAIMPGVIETRHHEEFTSPERMEQYRRETPVGRNGDAEEVGRAVVFLLGEGASFMTGALMDINGGRFLR